MTEKQIEAAARLLCEKRGTHPDIFNKFGDCYQHAWEYAAKEIRAHYEVLTSIATIMDMEGK